MICEITPDEDMFRDEFGNVADMTNFSGAVSSRMNNDQMYEHYICAFIRDVGLDCKAMMADNRFEEAWSHLIGAYAIAAPITYESVSKVCTTDARKKQHIIATCCEGDGIPRVTIAADDARASEDVFDAINNHRPPNEGKISFKNYMGEWETLRKTGIIAPKAVAILEKTAHNAMAAASARTQHHGFPTSTSVKGQTPGHIKEHAPKVFSETETRMMSNAIGAGTAVAKLAHVANNPQAAEMAAGKLFDPVNPFNYDDPVDYDVVPMGNHAGKVLVESSLGGAGVEFAGNTPQELHDSGVRVVPTV